MTEEDRRRDGVEAGLRWSWATLRQIEKLHAVENRARDDTRRRKDDARRGITQHFGYEHRLPFWELRTETHFCLVAARNLVRALDYLDPPAAAIGFPNLPKTMVEHLKILRDCFEHWNERENAQATAGGAGRAYRQLAKRGTGEAADAYRFGPGDTMVGGLSLDELATSCRHLHEYLLELEAGSFVWHGWSSWLNGAHD